MSKSDGWVGFDLDGTLAEYNGWKGVDHIGAPVPAMIERLKKLLADGVEVRIFTARVYGLADNITTCSVAWLNNNAARAAEAPDVKLSDRHQACIAIREWCLFHIGEVLPITCVKDYSMIALYDDRAVQVEPNTGRSYTFAEIDTLLTRIDRMASELTEMSYAPKARQIVAVADPEATVFEWDGRCMFPRLAPSGYMMGVFAGFLYTGMPHAFETGYGFEMGMISDEGGAMFGFPISKSDDVDEAFLKAATRFRDLRETLGKEGVPCKTS